MSENKEPIGEIAAEEHQSDGSPRPESDLDHGQPAPEHDNSSRDPEGQRCRSGRGFPGFHGRGPPPFIHFGRLHHPPGRRNCHEDPVDGADVDQQDEDTSTKASCRPRWGMGGRRGRGPPLFAHLGRFQGPPGKGYYCEWNCYEDETDDVNGDSANVSSDENEKTRKVKSRGRLGFGRRWNCPVFQDTSDVYCPYESEYGPWGRGMGLLRHPMMGPWCREMTSSHPPVMGPCGRGMGSPHCLMMGPCAYGMTSHPDMMGSCGRAQFHHGTWGHGRWGHGPWGHGPWGHGPWRHGPSSHGPWSIG